MVVILRFDVTGSAVNSTPEASGVIICCTTTAMCDGAVVDAVAQAVCHGPLGEQRCPAPADVLDDRGRPGDVQEGVVLTCERRSRQVLRRRARPNGVGGVRAEPVDRIGDRRRDIVGDGDGFDRPADFGAERAGSRPDRRDSDWRVDRADRHRRSDSDDSPERVRGHTESGRHGRCRRAATARRDVRPFRRRHRPVFGRSRRTSAPTCRPAASRSLGGAVSFECSVIVAD